VASRLHVITGDSRWQMRAEALVRAFAGRAAELGFYAAAYLTAADWMLNSETHLVIVGPVGDAEADRMHQRALAAFVPRRVVHRVTSSAGPLPPAVVGMLGSAHGSARAFLCRGATCSAPAATDAEWSETLSGLSAPAPRG
jgi:uncharacterized protein YyaL (SSP411 family)